MGFNVNDFNIGGGVSKVLTPGTHLCRIVDIQSGVTLFDPNKLQLTFVLESQPEGGGFTGIAIDKNDPSKGNYEGRIAYVRNGQYPFQDWERDGKVIDADTNACNFLARLANSLGVLNEMKKDPALQKNVNIDEFATIAKKYLCDPDLWAYYTIAGKEKWTEGYNNPNYNMYFAKYANRKNYVSLKEDGVIPFDEETHIIKTERGIPVTTETTVDVIEMPNEDPFTNEDPFKD